MRTHSLQKNASGSGKSARRSGRSANESENESGGNGLSVRRTGGRTGVQTGVGTAAATTALSAPNGRYQTVTLEEMETEGTRIAAALTACTGAALQRACIGTISSISV